MKKAEILIICTNDEILKTIVRLIDSNASMQGTGANMLEQALMLFKTSSFDLILIGAGLKTEEEELITNINRSIKKIPVVRHYGGGSGLLFTEIFQALGK